SYDISCQGTVPEAIISFLESTSFEDAVRNAVSMGGDADTVACITGGIAQAYYGTVPEEIEDKVLGLLDNRLKDILMEFNERYLLK
ncbi:MAG TPA: ADP-ribosylglycohydrolase family protein, partial [bacterium]|nr:ADP-ribosylglycohydrolase family protein [bacterium]